MCPPSCHPALPSPSATPRQSCLSSLYKSPLCHSFDSEVETVILLCFVSWRFKLRNSKDPGRGTDEEGVPGTRISSAPVTFSPSLDEGRAVCLAPWRPASVMATQSGWAQPSSRVCGGLHRRSPVGLMEVGLVLVPSAGHHILLHPVLVLPLLGSLHCRLQGLKVLMLPGHCREDTANTNTAQGLAQGPIAPPVLTLDLVVGHPCQFIQGREVSLMWVWAPCETPNQPLALPARIWNTCCAKASCVLSLHPGRPRVARKWPSKDRTDKIPVLAGAPFSLVSSSLERAL